MHKFTYTQVPHARAPGPGRVPHPAQALAQAAGAARYARMCLCMHVCQALAQAAGAVRKGWGHGVCFDSAVTSVSPIVL